ncbi:hypothetical protein PM082_007493 [Marasmius tenuissimus]|nr:hypothetical protein PM082_007493 [Marasmius tenuissimus]
MPSRRNGRKNKDNKDVVHQQPTPSSGTPDIDSVALPEVQEESNAELGNWLGQASLFVEESRPFEERARERDALPTPPLIEVDGFGAEAGVEGQGQREAVGPMQVGTRRLATVSDSPMLLDIVDNEVNDIPEVSHQNVDNTPSEGLELLIGTPELLRSPPSSPLRVSTPAPTPEPQVPVSPPRKRGSAAKATSPKSSVHTPTSSQTLAPLPIPLSTTATAVGMPSPPMVSRPVSFGQFTASAKASGPTSGTRRAESSLSSETEVNKIHSGMEDTIRPHNNGRRSSGRRPSAQYDVDDEAEERYQQSKPKRRLSYGGQAHSHRVDENHSHTRRGRHASDHQRSRSGISRAMDSGHLEVSDMTARVRDDGDSIVWARWDLGLRGRRLLFIGYYPLGLQIWDCSGLDTVSEILNLPLERLVDPDTSLSEYDFAYAGIIPPARSTDDSDSLDEYRPLAGILVSPKPESSSSRSAKSKASAVKASRLFIYSLSRHRVVKHVDIPGIAAGGGKFDIGDGFLVVSTTVPPALHILSPTFDVLHKIPSSALIPFTHSSAGHHNSVLPSPTGSSTSMRHSFWGTTATTTSYEHAYGNHNGGYNSPTHHGFDDNHHIYNDNNNNNNNNSVLLSSSTHLDSPLMHLPPPQPAPVYSVSGRYLAYASSPIPGGMDLFAQHAGLAVPPSLSSGAASLLSTGASTARSASIAALGSISEQIANFNRGGAGSGMGGSITQADLGNAAIKVGGGLLSGMKSLGGMAYKGAVSAASAAAANSSARGEGGGGGGGGMTSSMSGVSAFANRFFSKSAPAAIVTGDEQQRYSGHDDNEDGIGDDGTTYAGSISTAAYGETGWTVTVLDIEPLLSSGSPDASPSVVTRFVASKSEPVAEVWFSPDGNSILVARRDGQVAHVYSIRNNPLARIAQQREADELTEGGSSSPSDKSQRRRSNIPVPDSPPLHLYDLRRGRTPAAIESASWSPDGRWAAFATRNRTIHVFGVNPYGGRPDLKSHLEGLVKNYNEMPPLSTDLQPLVRLRVTKHPPPDRPKIPLAFTFLDSPYFSESTMPPNLLPAMASPSLMPTAYSSAGSHSYGSANSGQTVLSSSPSARSEPISPQLSSGSHGRPKNYQDVLVFDPTDGVLSLRRITVNIKAKDGNTSMLSLAGGSNAASHISRSLPGMGAVGKLAMSVSPTSQGRPGPSTLSQKIDVAGSELVAKDSSVATWNLKRKREWSEVKRALEEPVGKVSSKEKVEAVNWLAQAELSTFSKATRVLPRSIYLTHQFSFQALGEDYHALIRRYQFDIPGPKIEVRKGIEVSAYPTGTGESFVEGGGFRRDTRRLSSSFDEPLASAISGELDYSPPQPVLPMLPNGTLARSQGRSRTPSPSGALAMV